MMSILNKSKSRRPGQCVGARWVNRCCSSTVLQMGGRVYTGGSISKETQREIPSQKQTAGLPMSSRRIVNRSSSPDGFHFRYFDGKDAPAGNNNASVTHTGGSVDLETQFIVTGAVHELMTNDNL